MRTVCRPYVFVTAAEDDTAPGLYTSLGHVDHAEALTDRRDSARDAIFGLSNG